MRKIFTLTLCSGLLLISPLSKAQWITSGSNILNTNTGNVGIGTNAQTKLEVRGPSLRLSDIDIRYLQISQDANGQPHGRAYTNNIAGARQFKLTGWSHLPSNTGSEVKDIVHFDGYNLLLLKDNGGSVGIGTTQPNAPFEILTNTATVNSFNSQRWSTTNASYYLTLKTAWTNDGLNYNFIQTFGGTDYYSLSFFKGNVGIGTSRPDTKLAVKGVVHAEEVKVDLSVPAPDYVFGKEYDLRTLTEVEAYINQNKHLPEIPAAKEMEQNGVNLGEMNMMLLKKVEELTLYLIELKKENEAQQTRIKVLEEKTK